MSVWLECALPSPATWDIFAVIQRASDMYTYNKTANAYDASYDPSNVASAYKILNTDLDSGLGGQGAGDESDLWNGFLTAETIPDTSPAIISYYVSGTRQRLRREAVFIVDNARVWDPFYLENPGSAEKYYKLFWLLGHGRWPTAVANDVATVKDPTGTTSLWSSTLPPLGGTDGAIQSFSYLA